MLFLLRVQLPDVPGSLGRLASAIGEAGGDIEAIEIVEKRTDGTAVDDVLLTMAGAMPEISGEGLDISRYRRRREPTPRDRYDVARGFAVSR